MATVSLPLWRSSNSLRDYSTLAQPTSRYLSNTERVYLKVTIEKENLAGINFSDLDIIITQTAAIALEPLTTHPDEWAEPSHK